MTYLIDGRPLQDGSAVRGIGTYLRGLLGGFSQLGINHEIELVLRGGALAPPEITQYGLRHSRGHIPTTKRSLQPLLDPFMMAILLRRLKPQLYHGVEYAQPIKTTIPVVITMHDLIPFIFPKAYPWHRRERLLALRQLRKADAVIADSKSTANDLIKLAQVDKQNLHVVHLGVSANFRLASKEAITAVRSRHKIGNRRYVLAVGAFDPRKRIDLLVKVVAQLQKNQDVDLVIAGAQGNFETQVKRSLVAGDLAETTHLLGYVSNDDLIALYSDAECLLYTSEYEGFGLPPLEAMACGSPVALFNNSSLPEVAGNAAILVSNGDANAMSDAVANLLANPAEQNRRRQLGIEWAATFTWHRTAEQTLAVYQKLTQ